MTATTATRKSTATRVDTAFGGEHTYTAVRSDGGTTRRYGATYDIFIDGEKIASVSWMGGRRYRVEGLASDVRDSWTYIASDGGSVSDVMTYLARCEMNDREQAARPVLTVVEDAPVEAPLHERIRAMRGKASKVAPLDLVIGQVVRIDGHKARVQSAPERSAVTDSVMVEVYGEDNEWDVLSLGSTVPVSVIGSIQ